ncbi:hypothetical protein D9613_003555 [Agrocybe pediades]|uniref:Peptidase M12A domain-containing protein n=1 Tax=Agrocybe pediades TaxID=84607 RepID=A0A8H4QPB8_9AGAR|nr:hypothetical protein D9613_003555 [Agrocybe pediades]
MHLGLALVLALGCNIASVASSQDVEDSDGSSFSGIYSNRTTETIRIQDEYYGIRHVNYWVTSDNHAIIDGDVVYPGTLEDLLAKQYTGPDFDEDEDEGEESQSSDNSTSSIGRRSLSVFRGFDTWPRSTVVYRFSNYAAQRQVGRYVNDAISGWRRRAPYLRFRRVRNGGGTMRGVLTISFLPNDGCYASIGYNGGSGTVMNLGNGCYSAEALHEFGHALGEYQ